MNDIMSLFFKSKQIVPIDPIVYNVDNFVLWLKDLDISIYPDNISKLDIEKYLRESYGITKPESKKVNYLFNKLKSKNK
jgi:hypothetical protein